MLLLCILLNFCWSLPVKLSQLLDRVAVLATFICDRRDLERIIKKNTTVFSMKYIKYIHALLASLTICLDSTGKKLLAINVENNLCD